MILPLKFSGVSPNLNSSSWTWWQSSNVLNPGKLFHSNSKGSPSILSKLLYSGELFNHVNLSSHAMFDWGFSLNCICSFHKSRLVRTPISQICRTFFWMWDLSYLWLKDDCPGNSFPWIQLIPMLKTWTFSISQNALHRLVLHPSKIVLSFVHLIIPYLRMILILTTNPINFVSSSPLMNCCALAPPWGQTTGFTVLSWFSSSSNNDVLRSREKLDWKSCVLVQQATTGLSILSSINSSVFQSREDQALSSSHPE